jgi:hypothetical protein
METPKEMHWKVGKKILRYIEEQQDMVFYTQALKIIV